jgi:hypothetical protein
MELDRPDEYKGRKYIDDGRVITINGNRTDGPSGSYFEAIYDAGKLEPRSTGRGACFPDVLERLTEIH